ncbi:MAG TPA: SDR family oxidoreductase [Opitutaceae bacterium]|nr:SDR family oxidoreductase [Opitutaceae bacterium]
MHFPGQVVWITGASSGIGEALARAFAAEGARLALSSRRPDELERVRRSCVRPDEHVVVPLDLTQIGSFPAITADMLARCGRIDVLVNNAGVSQRALAVDTAPEVERAIMELDYFAPVALTRTVLPSMRARRSGHVVVVSSVMGYVGTPGRSTYAAAKHALHGYFDSLRAELWRENVAVTLACPGYVRTAISANALGARGESHGETDATHRTGIAPERCAAAIVKAVKRRRNEVYVGGREVAGIYLQRFVPGIFARIVRRMTFSVHASS